LRLERGGCEAESGRRGPDVMWGRLRRDDGGDFEWTTGGRGVRGKGTDHLMDQKDDVVETKNRGVWDKKGRGNRLKHQREGVGKSIEQKSGATE